MSSGRTFDIVIFGATGFTGKLMLRYWSRNRSRFPGMKIAVAGRSRAKLEPLVSEVCPGEGQVQIITADVADTDSITSMAKSARVLVSCVGPYVLYGEPCVKACAENGTHYVDITGEGEWIHRMVQKYHSTAVRTGAVIIPAAGFDSVPADLLARAAYGLVPESALPSSDVGITTSVFLGGRADKSKSAGGISHGTYQTLLHSLSTGEGLAPLDARVGRPRLSSGIRNDDVLRESLFPFELTSDAYVVRRTQQLTAAAGQGQFEYAHTLRLPNRFSGFVVKFGMFLLWVMCRIPPMLRFLQGRMTVGQGASDEARDNARATLRSCVRVWNKGQSPGAAPEKTGVVSLRLLTDGYNITAMTAMECAAEILHRDSKGTLKGKAGVTTPAAALESALTERCEQTGLMQFAVEAKL